MLCRVRFSVSITSTLCVVKASHSTQAHLRPLKNSSGPLSFPLSLLNLLDKIKDTTEDCSLPEVWLSMREKEKIGCRWNAKTSLRYRTYWEPIKAASGGYHVLFVAEGEIV